MKTSAVAMWVVMAMALLVSTGARAADEVAAEAAETAETEALGALVADGADDAPAEGLQIGWEPGPKTVALGDDLAEIALPDGFLFAGPDDTRKLLSSMGNRVYGNELGMIVPAAEGQDWFLVFEWEDVGYVKDDEKDEIDADALLESLQEATKEGNVWRAENGISAMTMTGWAEAPHYDEATHNLVWATQLDSEDGSRTVNYNVRVLGRRGLMSVTLVESTELFAVAKPAARKVLDGFAFKTGSTYSEWKSGDKVAEYGLTALVAAGAGAAAVKLGLFGVLAKFFGKAGKLLVVGAVAVAATVGNFVKKLFGKKTEE